MPTIQEILNYVDWKFPNASSVSNKVTELDTIHNRIFTKLSQLKNEIDMYEFETVADQPTYDLPNNCRIDSIIYDGLRVAQETPLTDTTKFDFYTFAAINDDLDGNRFYDGTNGLIGISPIPKISELSAMIFFHKRPVALTVDNLNAIPELDPDWHDVLKYALVQSVASTGRNPDPITANYYQSLYEERFAEILKDLYNQKNKTSQSKRKVDKRWRNG